MTRGPSSPNAERLRQPLRDRFETLRYPVGSVDDLAPALPDGDDDHVGVHDLVLTSSQIRAAMAAEGSFPYVTPETLADGLLSALEAEGVLPITDSPPDGEVSHASARAVTDAGPDSGTRVYDSVETPPTESEASGRADDVTNYCTTCGTDLRERRTDRYCPVCGEALV